MISPDDSVDMLLNASRQLGANVPAELMARGWICINPQAEDGDVVEWIWPPTAPVGYRGLREWVGEGVARRDPDGPPRLTPWLVPTRLHEKAEAPWRLFYGEALARESDEERDYDDDSALIDDLGRIESWPMTIHETRRVELERLSLAMMSVACDVPVRLPPITEPYGSRMDILHRRYSNLQKQGPVIAEGPVPNISTLDAQWLLYEAEAWASAERTARVGGPGWGIWGPEDG